MVGVISLPSVLSIGLPSSGATSFCANKSVLALDTNLVVSSCTYVYSCIFHSQEELSQARESTKEAQDTYEQLLSSVPTEQAQVIRGQMDKNMRQLQLELEQAEQYETE